MATADERAVDQWWREQTLDRRMSIFRWLNRGGPPPAECAGQLEIPIPTTRKRVQI